MSFKRQQQQSHANLVTSGSVGNAFANTASNSICVATVLLDTGIIPMTEPETEILMEALNLTDEDNFLIPEVTSLAFNFDGTVRSGAGQPREFQLGIRLVW